MVALRCQTHVGRQVGLPTFLKNAGRNVFLIQAAEGGRASHYEARASMQNTGRGLGGAFTTQRERENESSQSKRIICPADRLRALPYTKCYD